MDQRELDLLRDHLNALQFLATRESRIRPHDFRWRNALAAILHKIRNEPDEATTGSE